MEATSQLNIFGMQLTLIMCPSQCLMCTTLPGIRLSYRKKEGDVNCRRFTSKGEVWEEDGEGILSRSMEQETTLLSGLKVV